MDTKAGVNGDDDESGSEEDSDMEVSTSRRRPYAIPKHKAGTITMQDKVWEAVQKQMIVNTTNHAHLKANENLMATCKRACDMRDRLLNKIDGFGDRLPPNTLDQLIEELGGPDVVAVSVKKNRFI